MTSLWGPLGWMTLHSISFLYPENPIPADKAILKRYMECFRDTSTCPHCHQHFKVIFENYVKAHPEWANSRFDVFMFVVRAHNTVNKRLEKPKCESVQACIDRYNANTQLTPGIVYRAKYLDYLSRNYGNELTGDSMMKIQIVRELRKITAEYWNKLGDDSTSSFNFDANVLEYINEMPSTRRVMTSSGSLAAISTAPSVRLGLSGGRFRLKTG